MNIEDPFELVTDLPGEQFGEPVYRQIGDASLMDKRVRIISSPQGGPPSKFVGMTGRIVEANVNKYPKYEIQVYRVKLNRPATGDPEWDMGIWFREDDLEVIA